jgi:hypothetical protein
MGEVTRPPARIQPMLDLLRQAWEKHPDQRLGQIIGNAARRDPEKGEAVGRYRDPFNVEDDEMWKGLERLAGEGDSAP